MDSSGSEWTEESGGYNRVLVIEYRRCLIQTDTRMYMIQVT